MEGLSGHAASHRSVIGEHRSEAEARETAAHERSRLEVIYGEAASAWRIIVIRDGEIVAEERPAALADAAPPPPAGAPDPGVAAEAEGEGEVEPAPATEREQWPDMDLSGPVPDWVISRFEESIARRRERERDDRAEDDAGTDDAAGT